MSPALLSKTKFFAALLSLIVAQYSNAQEAIEDTWMKAISGQPKRFAGYIDDNGRLDLTIVEHASDLGIKFQPFEFYSHKSIKAELKLTDAESKNLEKIIGEWRKTRKESKKRLGLAAGSDRDILTWAREFELTQLKTTAAMDKKIQKLIGRSKYQRLRQIQLRWLIRQHGLARLMSDQSMLELLGIPGKPANRIKRETLAAAKAIEKDIAELVSDAHKIWFDLLTEEQKKLYEKKWGKVFESNLMAIDQLIWQLGYRERDRISESPTLAHLAKIVVAKDVVIDIDGKIASKPKDSGESDSVLRFRAYRELFQTKYFCDQLELNVGQRKSINETINLHDEEREQLATKLAMANKTSQLKVKLEKGPWTKEYHERMDELSSKTVGQIDDILVDYQKKLFAELIREIETQRFGPLADILDGELGKKMKLTDGQKDMLVDKAKKAREMLQKKTLELEEQALNRILDSMTTQQQMALRKAIGKPLTHSDGTVGLLLFHLRNPKLTNR
jgi:DNA polymerase III delta prime subunit